MNRIAKRLRLPGLAAGALRLAVPALLAVLVVAVYAPVRHHGFTLFDDPDYVTENPLVRSGWNGESLKDAVTGFTAGNWHPVTMVSHLLDVSLFGLDPGMHHVTSLFFHLCNILLLYLALSRMTGARLPAAAASAWFAVHPIHVESVAWIAERKDVLSGFFWMLCLLGYHRYVQHRTVRSYLVLAAAFALGLAAKPMLVTLPMVLLLLDYWPLGRSGGRTVGRSDGGSVGRWIGRTVGRWVGRTVGASIGRRAGGGGGDGGREGVTNGMSNGGGTMPVGGEEGPAVGVTKLIWEKMPLLALSAASAAVTWVAQKSAGAVGSFAAFPLDERLANAVRAYWRYLQTFFWPRDLALFYPHPGAPDLLRTNLEGAALIGICLAVLWLGRRHPYLSVGWLWFLITLLPVIGLVQVGAQAMADRYAYIPLLGLYIAAAWGLWESAAGRARRMAVAVAVVALSAAALAVAARHQVSLWRSDVVLFSHAVRVTEGNYRMLNNLGLAYAEQGELDRAIACYRRALSYEPRFPDARLNLGNAYLHKGETDRAKAAYETVLRHEPGHRKARLNIAVLLLKEGRTDAAVEAARGILQQSPDAAMAHNLLGQVELERARPERAAEHFRRAVESDPYFTKGIYNWGVSLEKQGKVAEALQRYERAVALDPELAEAHNNLGRILVERGRLQQALAHYLSAIRARPLFALAHFNAAQVMTKLDRSAEALDWYRRAVLADEDNPVFRKGLADALMRSGRFGEAAAHFRKIAERNPQSAAALADWAAALAGAGNAEAALARYRQSLRIDADAALVHNDLGILLIQMGRTAEGVEHLRTALRLSPKDERILRNLEEAHKRLAPPM